MCFLQEYDKAVVEENIDDWLHKHNNTFVVAKADKKVWYVYGAGRDGEVALQDAYGTNAVWKYRKEPAFFSRIKRERIVFEHTDHGVTRPVCFVNVPERRNRIGLCNTNSQFMYVHSGRMVRPEFTLVQSYVDRKCTAPDKLLFSELHGVIDSNWSVIRHNVDKANGVLYFGTVPVALLHPDKITVANKLYNEEVADLLRKNPAINLRMVAKQ